MVSTRQAGKTCRSVEEGTPPADGGEEYEELAPEPNKTRGTKRARVAKATVKGKEQEKRRKKAKLSMLPGMPVDILYEIFSLVHPRDLMHVSWTAKVFNEFLTTKSSRHVWQASFKTIAELEQPPPCPSELTEMAYANLLYSQRCMNCAGVRSPIPAWRALVRLCGSCVEEIAVDSYDAWPDDLDTRGFPYVGQVLPTFAVKYPTRGVIRKVLRSDMERFIKELAAAGKGSEEHVIEKHRSTVDERSEFMSAIEALEGVAEKLKENARADVKKRRIERIWEKLSEEGWGEEIAARKSMYEPGLMEIKGVVMIRPLGEKAWAELRGPLNDFMRNELARINAELEAQRCKSRIVGVEKLVDSFRCSLPHPHDFSPSTADVCWIPEVRKTIIDGTDEEFQDCEADLRSRIPELSASWLEERRKFFLQLLPQDSPSLEHLFLATTLFDCANCRESGMRIKDAISHCCHNYRYRSERRENFSSVASANAFYGIPWDSGSSKFEFSVNLSLLVREVIVECGENPDTITTQEMNRKHHRFARIGWDESITVLNWLQTVEHKRHRRDTPCRIMRPDEFPEYVPEPEYSSSRWACLRCWQAENSEGRELGYRSFTVIKDHLNSSHRITNPTEEDYCSKNPDAAAVFKYRPGSNA